MKILLTGGTGFIGSYILRELAGTEHSVRILTRDGSSRDLAIQADNFEVYKGNIRERESLRGPMEGCDAVIHLVGIIREAPSSGITFESIHAEGSRNVASAAKEAGVRTFVHMSANGARPDGVSPYQTSKWQAEKAVESAGFETYTIFRPSIVFGKPDRGRPEFASDLVRQLVRPFPILPVFGDGKFEMQPVAVESLASAMVQAVNPPEPNTIYEVAGPKALPYVEILDVLARAMGSDPKPKVHVPPSLVSVGITLMGWTGLLPITQDQLDMLLEGNTCDFERFHDAFRITPVPFEVERLGYLR